MENFPSLQADTGEESGSFDLETGGRVNCCVIHNRSKSLKSMEAMDSSMQFAGTPSRPVRFQSKTR
jgi:hypothetical protein